MKYNTKCFLGFCSILIALAFAGCNTPSTEVGGNDAFKTIWFRLIPSAPVQLDGIRTATLILDFNKTIDGLDDTLQAADLKNIFTFTSSGSTGMRPPEATHIVKSSDGLYTLTVAHVPYGDRVLVTINKSSITPASRWWYLPGVSDTTPEPSPTMLAFKFEPGKNASLSVDAVGVIDQQNKTVMLVVPDGTNLAFLTPTVTTNSGTTYTPVGTTDFTSPRVNYSVHSKKMSVDYKVTVTKQQSNAASITYFAFTKEENYPLANTAVGIIDQSSREISVTMPLGTVISALKPNIVFTGARVSPNSLVPQNFSVPLVYTVTAPDNVTTHSYTVTVTLGAPPAGPSTPAPSMNPFAMTYEASHIAGNLVGPYTYDFETLSMRVSESDLAAHFPSKLGTDQLLTGVSGASDIPSATFKFHNTATMKLSFWFLPDEYNLLATRRTNADGSTVGSDESKWSDTGFSGSIPANGDLYITIAPRKTIGNQYHDKTFKIYWGLDGTSLQEAVSANRQVTAPYKFQWELLISISFSPSLRGIDISGKK
jgi:hypothetical protein